MSSSLLFNSKRNVSDEQNERHKRMLAAVLKEEGNKSCADCKTRNPTWASVNLGVFVCLTCSGIHRSLGVHISQVRSCNLDTWLPKQVEFCQRMGNIKGNRYWEARLPKDFRRPPSGNPNPELAAFIRSKYVDRLYCATDAPPPTIDSYEGHPYVVDSPCDDTSASTSGANGSIAAPSAQPAVNGHAFGGMPATKPASSPALMHDLLGGFDELATGSSVAAPVAPTMSVVAPAAQPADDPFGSFVSAGAAAAQPGGTGSAAAPHPARSSLDWTDFHAAPAPAVPPPPLSQTAPGPIPTVSQLFPHVATAASHHRSASVSEGLPIGSGASGGAGGAAPSAYGRMASHSAVQQPAGPSGASRMGTTSSTHQPHPAGHAPAAAGSHSTQHHHNTISDPFATMGDDLLAGLTIHQIMDTAPTPSASSGGAGAADPFPLSPVRSPSRSSKKDKEAHLPAPGAGHKRHPSHAKSADEILRLFDSAPSTGGPAIGSSSTAQDDPFSSTGGGFGDFLGAPAPPPAAAHHTSLGGLGSGPLGAGAAGAGGSGYPIASSMHQPMLGSSTADLL